MCSQTLRDSGFTIFVNYVSKRIHVSSLKEVFQVYGVVLDVFIAYKSLKRKFADSIFAFVRFSNRDEASLAVKRADGRVLDGFKIRVFHDNTPVRLCKKVDGVRRFNKVWKPVLREARSFKEEEGGVTVAGGFPIQKFVGQQAGIHFSSTAGVHVRVGDDGVARFPSKLSVAKVLVEVQSESSFSENVSIFMEGRVVSIKVLEFGTANEGVPSANRSVDLAVESAASGSSVGKNGIPISSGGILSEACNKESLGDCFKDHVVDPTMRGCGFEVGREHDSFQTPNSSNHVGLQRVEFDGVVRDGFNIAKSFLVDASRKKVSGMVVGDGDGSPDCGFPRGIGTKVDTLVEYNNVCPGGEEDELKVGPILACASAKGNSFNKLNSNFVHAGRDFEETSVVPQRSFSFNMKMKKFGSMLNIQGKVLSKTERRRRDRALKKFNLNKSDLLFSELSGTSISNSVLKQRWAEAFVEAQEAVYLDKQLGIMFGSPETGVL
ncbi:hypothetical protein F3Y22_tig00009009pilonHSYRG00299 [Hibiscus syriacus]|uniref:RRM domain-containing protein n=1 Tax=Hibiscus syriacus TaxID=106335 RepID=A0A6A3CDN5_HIBSY|nr:hypothetical protein F3Y22_tig00009009pilonHSYRG00299 [Hibiscus syriacus]